MFYQESSKKKWDAFVLEVDEYSLALFKIAKFLVLEILENFKK